MFFIVFFVSKCLSVPIRNKAFYTDAMTKLDFHVFDASIKTAPTSLKL